ncbi:MAG TPA: hypothetical protein VFG68_17625 [Fimbriiglobus sp.]|nr:hypothetical protein [Fimbriiglobus sp.]
MASDIRGMSDINNPMEERAHHVREERTSAEIVAGGSVVETIGGAGAVVLAIVGLAGIYPIWMAGISAIALGAALMLRGMAVASRYYSLLDETTGGRANTTELGSGIGAEVVGGAAGIVLGILALLEVDPMVLLPVAAIVFGGTLLIGCGSNRRINSLIVEQPYYPARNGSRRIAGDILEAANGAQALVAVAVIVLGIVALLNPAYNLTLDLIAFLAAAGSVVLSGGTATAKMVTLLQQRPYSWRHG